MAFLLAGLTFLVVVVILLVAAAVSGGPKREKVVARRLEAIERGAKRGSTSLELKLVRDELLSDIPTIHRILSQWSWATRLRDYIAQAGLTIKPGRLILLSGVLALGAYLAVNFLYQNIILAFVAAGIAAVCPFAYVSIKRNNRLHKFERNFPEAIDLLGRAVRAGHSFSTGLEMISTELAEPVAGEFRKTFEEQNFGLPLRDALLNLAERVPLIDVRFFVTALLIQKETGGNLAEILDNLARIVRERFKILGEVRIRTAQGRLTAGILIAVPPLMVIALRTINPGYMKPLFNDPWGPMMLGVAATLQVLGSIILWKIVRIEV